MKREDKKVTSEIVDNDDSYYCSWYGTSYLCKR